MDRRTFLRTGTAALGSLALGLSRPTDAAASDRLLRGDVSGVVPPGQVWRITGDVNLTGDLVVEGTLTGVDSFTLNGNGYQIVVQHGGRLLLEGLEKTAWCRWGDNPVGWQVGDRLAVAPTADGVYVPSETTWQGSWEATTRPADSPEVTLIDGSVGRPEVANLSQSITLSNLSRVMFHMGAGVQTLRHLKVLDSGRSSRLDFYPLHFHKCYDSARGSTLDSVVVEGGRNHAFVPHGSNGIGFPRCVAYNTLNVPFWWNRPIPRQTPRDVSNDPEDISWDGCLALGVVGFPGDDENIRLAGFWLGSGLALSCLGSVAVCVDGDPARGPRQRSGFHWPENASRVSWVFRDCVSHNNANSGIFTWQNTDDLHLIQEFTAYHNGTFGIDHGAYVNPYHYGRLVLSNNGAGAVRMRAQSFGSPAPPGGAHDGLLLFEDIKSDDLLVVAEHRTQPRDWTYFRRCQLSGVVYEEAIGGENPSWIRFEDCGLMPDEFDLASINAASMIEICEGGNLVNRWEAGAWS